MGWIDFAGIGGPILGKWQRDKKKRDASRRAEQAADPMGREQNDKRMYDATMQSKDQEGTWSGRVDTSRAATDAAGNRLATGGASRSDRLAGGGGGLPLTGSDSRGGIPGYTTPNAGVTAVGGGTPAWQSSFAPGGGGSWTPDDSRTSGPTGGNGPTPGGMTRGWTPTNVQGLSFDAISRSTPGATDAYDSGELRGVDVNGTMDRYTGGPNRFQEAMRGAKAYGAVGQGGNLASWNDGGLGDFNAGDAVKQYATGAWSDAKLDLGDLLSEQEAASQRGGRLNSGFFDRDNGRVIQNVTNRFSNALAQQAVNAAGITADTRSRAAQMRLSRATDADQNYLDAAMQGQDLTARDQWEVDGNTRDVLGLGVEAGRAATSAALERGAGIDRNMLDAAQFRDKYRLDAATTGANLNLDRAKSLDEMGLDRNKYVDSWDQENAQFGDTMDYNRQRDAANLAEGREGRDTETWMALGDRYRNELTAMDDRITGRRNAKAQAKQNRFQNMISLGGLGLRAATAAAGGG